MSFGPLIQCHGCSSWNSTPDYWLGGPHQWRCPQCNFAHDITFGSAGGIARVAPIDRFSVPVKALAALDKKTARDVERAFLAANVGCAPGAIVLLRRALERECKAAGAKNGTLAKKIEALKERGILSPIQASTAHAIRAFANEYGAHPEDDGLDDVSDEELAAAINLTIAVVCGLAKQRKSRARDADDDIF